MRVAFFGLTVSLGIGLFGLPIVTVASAIIHLQGTWSLELEFLVEE